MNEAVIGKFITTKRLSTYSDFSEYEQNLIKSKEYYVPLSILEIALRNSINMLFTRFYGGGWLVGGAQFLRGDLLAKIDDAKVKLNVRNEDVTKDKLVAELSFGFWTALFQSPYDKQMRLNNLKHIFPNLPKKEEYTIDRKIISAKLDHIRKFRNRIFHYEKIIGKSEYDSIEADIYEILRYFDEEISAFSKRLNDE